MLAMLWSEAPTSSTPPQTSEAFAASLPRHQLSGCNDAGEIEVPAIRVRAEPGGISATNRLVGELSGTSRSDSCAGAIVTLVESVQREGRTFYQVASVVNEMEGWVSELFIGPSFTS